MCLLVATQLNPYHQFYPPPTPNAKRQQLAQLRQQLSALRAENVALKRTIGAAGGDPEALAALVSGAALPPSEALQEAYDELALRCNALEAQRARDAGALSELKSEAAELRERLLAAETARDSLRLRWHALKQAAREGGEAQLRDQIAAMVAAGSEGGAPPAATEQQPGGDGATRTPPAMAAAAAAAAAMDGGGEGEDVDVVAELRARISELEGELRQARTLQRAQSSMLFGGAGDGAAAAAAAAAVAATGGAGALGGRRGGLRTGAPRAGGEVTFASAHGDAAAAAGGGDATPLTPHQQRAGASAAGGAVPLDDADPARDAELIAGTTAHFVGQEQLRHRLDDIVRQMAAKQRRLAALQTAVGAAGAVDPGAFKEQYDRHLRALQQERDGLLKEKSGLLAKMQKAAEASAEERRRLEALYKDKLAGVERRVRELGEREKEARRGARQLVRARARACARVRIAACLHCQLASPSRPDPKPP